MLYILYISSKHIFVFHKELAHAIMEAEKSRDLPSASWRPREVRAWRPREGQETRGETFQLKQADGTKMWGNFSFLHLLLYSGPQRIG